MVLYNTTFVMDANIGEDFLGFVEKQWLPIAQKSGLMKEVKILKMVEELEQGNATFSVQVFLKTMDDVLTFQKTHEVEMTLGLNIRFKGQYASFSTKLWVIG